MLFHFLLFFVHFAASTSFLLDGVQKNATVGIPVQLTWRLQGDDPDNFRFSLRNVSHGLEEVERIPFTLPANGTREGTVMVNFPFPGSYLIEAINTNTNEVIVSSGTISVHSAKFAVAPVTTSSGSTSVTTASMESSSAASTSSTSFLHSGNVAPSSTSSVSIAASQTTVHTVSIESPLSPNSLSISLSGESTFLSPAPSHLTESSSIGGDTSTLTATTPASTSNSSNPRRPQKTSTIIGAVIGVIGFVLFLLLGVALCRRLYRNRSPMLLPSPKGMFPYLQSRGMIQTLRKNDATASDSTDVIMSTPMNSFMVDVEEGVPGADLPRKERESVTDTRRTSVASDVNVPVLPLSGGFSARGSLQILAGEQLSHPSTPGLLVSHAGNNEIAEEITRLRTRIQELAIDRTPLWDQDSQTEPPPAYVKDAY
ncbi:hypothetical protein EDD85DRAFT_1027313 [Armillaria nabsnona]|nr:hypothetical protein EDD85DRAFT_1027313 [Armillaria nabsnona]